MEAQPRKDHSLVYIRNERHTIRTRLDSAHLSPFQSVTHGLENGQSYFVNPPTVRIRQTKGLVPSNTLG
jgi:hypothetical protein